jgi:hypothetical protein
MKFLPFSGYVRDFYVVNVTLYTGPEIRVRDRAEQDAQGCQLSAYRPSPLGLCKRTESACHYVRRLGGNIRQYAEREVQQL